MDNDMIASAMAGSPADEHISGGGKRTVDQDEAADLGPISLSKFAHDILNKGKHKKEKTPEVAASDDNLDTPHDSNDHDMSIQGDSTKRKNKTKSKSKSKSSKNRGEPRKPSAAMLKYSMTHYDLYNPKELTTLPIVGVRHSMFSQYDGYKLFMIPSALIADDIPHRSWKYSKRGLGTLWQAEFDKNGMTRANRVPLGHAAKEWKNVGDVDIDGNVLQEGEQGWYYLWHRGLQLLGGQECLDAGLYLQRPSPESDKCEGTTWKQGFRAAIQLPAGHRNDTTFRGMKLPDFAFLAKDATETSAGDVESPSHGGESSEGRQGLNTVPKIPAAESV